MSSEHKRKRHEQKDVSSSSSETSDDSDSETETSDSGSIESSSSSTDSSEAHKKKKHSKEKKRQKKKKLKKEKKRRRKEKKHKKEKKEKKEKKAKKETKEKKNKEEEPDNADTVKDGSGIPASLGYSFGKFGIIQETDYWKKQEEFFAWLRDIKDVNPEQHGQMELRKLFVDYREDYNLGLLNEKYYDLRAWDRKKAKEEYIAAKKASRKQEKKAKDLKHIAKEWERAAMEAPTKLENDEDLRRQEFRQKREEYEQRKLREEREMRQLELSTKEREAMIRSLSKLPPK